MDRKEIKEAAALFNTVKTMVEEVETPVSFLNEAEEVITVDLDKMPRDKKGLEEWEKAAPVKVYEAVNAIESVKIGDSDARAIDDSMLAEYLPELVKTLYMEVKAAMVPPAEEKAAKPKKEKKEKGEKTDTGPKYTRANAFSDSLRLKPKTVEELIAASNEQYVDHGGKDNLKEAQWMAKYATGLLTAMGLLKISEGEIKYIADCIVNA